MKRHADLPPLDERAGPAERISTEAARAIVDAAIAVHRRGPVVPLIRRFALAAGISLVFAGAVSAGYLARKSQPQVAPPMEWQGGPQSTAPVASSPAPASKSALPAATDPGPSEAARPAEPAVPPPSGAGPTVSSRPSPGLTVHKRAAPTDLLANANVLRAKSRWRDAERVYRQVVSLAPRSEDAYAATVAAASLRLDHLGDAKGALPLYSNALRWRPRGALAEEARWGVSEVYRALGNRHLEARALREFIEAHPGSLMRSTAEARLAAQAIAPRVSGPSPR